MQDYPPLETRPKTIFVDIDGTIFQHIWPTDPYVVPGLLPGVLETFKLWNLRGYYIVLTTARTENFEQITLSHLNHHKLPFNKLLMGLPTGQRVLINDRKPEESNLPTAVAINLDRDVGLEGVQV